MNNMNVTMKEWVMLNGIKRIISKNFNEELSFNINEHHWDMGSSYCRGFKVNSSSVLEVSKNIATYLTNIIPNLTDKYDFGLSPRVLQRLINQLTLICISTNPDEVVMNPADIRLEEWFKKPDLKNNINAIDQLIRLENIANETLPDTVISEKIHEVIDLWITCIGLNEKERNELHWGDKNSADLCGVTGTYENHETIDEAEQSDNAPEESGDTKEEFKRLEEEKDKSFF